MVILVAETESVLLLLLLLLFVRIARTFNGVLALRRVSELLEMLCACFNNFRILKTNFVFHRAHLLAGGIAVDIVRH